MRYIALVLLALALAVPVSARPERRTVVDYFKMLPSKLFEVSSKERMKWLRQGSDPAFTAAYNRSVVDLKNDFLRFPGDGAQGRLDVAVFRFHGQDTIAVVDDFEGTTLSFWRERNGRLRDVTKQMFPFRLRGKITHELPRVGTTIRVFKGGWPDKPTRAVVASFKWRGGRFVRG